MLKNKRYEIEDEVANGSYGIIYKARDNYLCKYVAIKTLNDYSNPENLKRFEREINALKELSRHPHIVEYLDDFPERQKRYLVMEYLSETTLYTLVTERQEYTRGLPYWLAFRYIYQIGLALKAAHKKDWIHRDVHPSNIMIVNDKAVLIDFTIVRYHPSPTYGFPTGNYNFAPYEQRLGQYNPKLDVYALSACLYFALTGQIPVASERRRTNDPLIKPRHHNRSIKQKVEDVILKGMKQEPEYRTESIEKWLKLLHKPWRWRWQRLVNKVCNFFSS